MRDFKNFLEKTELKYNVIVYELSEASLFTLHPKIALAPKHLVLLVSTFHSL